MNSMIPVKEFAERRRKLMDRMAPDSIAILPAAPERVRNRDVLHPFRQDSDFQYLTGFGEPEAVQGRGLAAPGLGFVDDIVM